MTQHTHLHAFAGHLASRLAPLDLFERVALAAREVAGRIVFTTSFGIEDQAVAHAIFTQRLPVEVVSLDTGRLFPETYDVWVDTERRYDVRIRAFSPERQAVEALVENQGPNGFRHSVEARQSCCFVRKVEPLARALEGASGWVTGLRADQSSARAQVAPAQFDTERALVKINPLFDWPRERVADYVHANGIPRNVLHDRGFLSIGCAPCTRAIAAGEPERAGRWWWESESKKECGLHLQGLKAPAETDTPKAPS